MTCGRDKRRAYLDEEYSEVRYWLKHDQALLGLCPKPRSFALWPESPFALRPAGRFPPRCIPVRTGARFALQRGPILRPAARSVSTFFGSAPKGTDLGLNYSLTETALS